MLKQTKENDVIYIYIYIHNNKELYCSKLILCNKKKIDLGEVNIIL